MTDTAQHLTLVTSTDETPATAAETRAFLLDRSGRPFAPIRKAFVQQPPGSATRHGPLAQFVTGRDLRALRAYLLITAITSSGASEEGWSTTLDIATWARAFNLTRDAELSSASTAASKVLTRLEDRQLITRARKGRERKVRVTLLREDASGQAYTRPGAGNSERFLKVPNLYWTGGWHERLDLPATAMLLVSLHENSGFRLPAERVPAWYGWSADTAERGLAALKRHGILTQQSRYVKAPLSPTGLAPINEYTLAPEWNLKAGRRGGRKAASA